MSYALRTIWYERQRFLPAVLAVTFAAVLLAVQAGLCLGLVGMMSLPVDDTTADVWVGYPGVRSVDLGRPVPERWIVRLACQPEVERAEPAVQGFALWTRRGNSPAETVSEVCTVIGCRLHPESLAAVRAVRTDSELLARLARPFAVVVDESELGRLRIRGEGDRAEVLGHEVCVVGVVRGYRSLGGPYLFCSIATARELLGYRPGEVTYLLGKTRDAAEADRVARRLEDYPRLTALTAAEFSTRSRLHWLLTTKAGVTVGFTALLGLLVGAIVTGQTLYAATAASRREFATLRAMGIPRWRLRLSVVMQAFWVGLFGLTLAVPIILLLARGAESVGTTIRLHPLLVLTTVAVTMAMAIGSGLFALRSFQRIDPAHNIR